MKKLKTLLVLAVVSLAGFNANAQTAVTIEGGCNQGRYQQNFNVAQGLNTLTGWTINGTYQVDEAGTSNLTGLRAYSNLVNNDKAFGLFRRQGSAGNPIVGIVFQNQTPAPITKITVTYRGEQWRKGNTLSDRLNFSYSVDAGIPPLTGGTYTNVNQLNFEAPQNSTICGTGGNALDGNLAANSRTISYTITLNQAVGVDEHLLLRWVDFNQYNNPPSCIEGHGLAIDDLDVSFSNDSYGPIGEIQGSSVVCIGSPVNYAIQYLLPPNTANWSATDGAASTSHTFTWTPASTGTHYINAQVNSGCSGTVYRTFKVDVVDAPTVNISASSNCNKFTLTANIVGPGQVTRWEITPFNQPMTTIVTNSSTINYDLTTTSASITVYVSNGGCEVTATIPINFVAPPNLTLTAQTQCSGGSLTANAASFGSFVISPDPTRIGTQFGSTVTYNNLPSGTYTVFYSDPTGGCTVSKSITLGTNATSAPTMRDFPYATSRTSITAEWNAYTGASSYTLQWRPNGTTTWNTISGITATRRAVSGLVCSNFYQFRVRAICGNGTASPYSAIKTWNTQPCTREGISSDLTASDVSLYPNPNNGNFNLNFVAESAGSATLFVADITGKTVANQTITLTEGENNIPVSLDGVAPGIYLVRFTVGENTFTQKVIVE